jgi:hypothetical protein
MFYPARLLRYFISRWTSMPSPSNQLKDFSGAAFGADFSAGGSYHRIRIHIPEVMLGGADAAPQTEKWKDFGILISQYSDISIS